MLYLAFQAGGPDNWVPVTASPSTMVLLFTLVLSVGTGVIFGIAPAWMTSHAEPVEALRGANRSVGGNRTWAQKTLVVAQAAMSLVLLSAAAMLGQSLRNLEHQNFGFEPNSRYMVRVDPLLSNYKPEQLPLLFRQIEDRLRGIPGVRMASSALYAPMSGDNWNTSVHIEGKPEPGPHDNYSAGYTRLTPGFFQTIGAKMLAGRLFSEDDDDKTRLVAVVNEAFAKHFFGNENPIGRHFGPGPMKYAGMFEIVGVVSNIRFNEGDGYDKPVPPMFYLPEAQTAKFSDPAEQSGEAWSHYLNNIVIWAPGNPPNLQGQVKRAIADVDPNFVVNAIDPYPEVLHDDFAQQNMIANLTLLFGVVGLVLAAVGLYGVTAYGVEQRTSEIGVRMALGADRQHVVRMVLRGAFLQVGIGLAIGIPAAVGAGYLIASQLFGVAPRDPLMLAIATALLAIAALIAAVLPAYRAANLDPVIALRTE